MAEATVSNSDFSERAVAQCPQARAFERAERGERAKIGLAAVVAAGRRELPPIWSLIAIALICGTGGMAIYFIHATTPVNASRTAYSNYSGPRELPAKSGQLSGKMPVGKTATAAQVSVWPAHGSDAEGLPVAPRRMAASPSSDTPGAVSAAKPDSRVVSALQRVESKIAIEWSKPKTDGSGSGKSLATQVGNKPAVTDAAKTNIDSSKGARVTALAATKPIGDDGPKFPPQSSTTNAPLAPAATQATVVVAIGTSARGSSGASNLRSAQDGQCADASFLGRLVCDERVRIRYCRDRWDAHPDCVTAKPTNNQQ